MLNIFPFSGPLSWRNLSRERWEVECFSSEQLKGIVEMLMKGETFGMQSTLSHMKLNEGV
jgi:hypothetical protein